MENLSHSRPPNRGSTSVSKKICNGSNGGGAFVAQTIYDDVYGGPPKFGSSALSPRFEDYGEIFGSFHALRASSIPILDLPAVDETEFFFDARSSAFDYAEVFGGFDGLDFPVSSEELINSSKCVDDGSSDEAWTPAGTESLSDCSDHSGKSHYMSNGDSNQSFGGSTEFCISYNKVNQESNENISNGKTHVTQLQIRPGFTYLVDEANPSPEGAYDDPSSHAIDDSYLNIDFSTGKVKGKHLLSSMAPPVDGDGRAQPAENYSISQNRHRRDVCRSYEDFITVSEISLRTEPSRVPPPSHPPPVSTFRKGDYTNTTSNCRDAAAEVILDNHSFPLFDVEVDAGSSATASAAAMKEAMEKAQAQLQSAKDMWERKKEGVHGRVKLDPKNYMKDKEGNLTKVPKQFKSFTKVRATSEIHDCETKVPAREERQNVVKAAEVCSISYGGQELLTETTIEDRNGSGLLVSQKHDCSSQWKEDTQVFELERADISGVEFAPVNNDKINFVHGQVESETVTKVWEHGENSDNKMKPFHKAHILQEEVNNVRNVIYRMDEDHIKLKLNKHETRQREQVKLKISQGVFDLSTDDKKFGVAQECMETKKLMSGASNLEKDEKLIEFEQRENELEAERLVLLEDAQQKKKKVVKREETEDIVKGFDRVESTDKLEETIKNKEREKVHREALEREKLEQGMMMLLEQQKHEKRMNLVLEDENLKGQKAGERQLEGVPEEEAYGEREKGAYQVGLSEKFKLAGKWEDDHVWSKGFQNREECKTGINDSFPPVDIEGMPRYAGKCEGTETMVKDSHEGAELKCVSTGHDEKERLKARQKVNSTLRTQAYMEMENSRMSAGSTSCQMDDNKNHPGSKIAHDQNETMGISEEFLVLDENGERKSRVNDGESSSENGEIENLQFDENSCASGMCEAEVEHDIFSVKMEDTSAPLPLDEWTKKPGKKLSFEHEHDGIQVDQINMESPLVSENSTSIAGGENEVGKKVLEMEDMEKTLPQYRSDEKAGQDDVGVEQVPVGRVNFVTRMNPQEKVSCSEEDKGKSLNQVEEKVQKVSVPGVEVRAEKGREAETTQTTISERIQKGGEFAREVNANQATERKEKSVNQSHASKGKESERVRCETGCENEILRKLEEEREREREREKDRMHVDRIALEPRDRVAVESRERAERAALERLTAEARHRTLAEARERLEKACAEARENSLAGKANMEARVRAERAAVERATAEARERAAEKAISDRNSFGVRERIERSVSDKFSSSRNNEMRQTSSFSGQLNLQSQSFGSSNASRYTNYSVYDERNEGVDGESPQRCKARLERHQRTAERAAKALAEKNMRDILAQREQAERNRLAETLDADVRRWSSGKEGNLRALVSTLQYILGPDSGWQAIPLTEVITAAAVKKAYRKATLCVHPDKLQQRGASIQQKYICEKVFDLLKEAWNKFNSEER